MKYLLACFAYNYVKQILYAQVITYTCTYVHTSQLAIISLRQLAIVYMYVCKYRRMVYQKNTLIFFFNLRRKGGTCMYIYIAMHIYVCKHTYTHLESLCICVRISLVHSCIVYIKPNLNKSLEQLDNVLSPRLYKSKHAKDYSWV